MLVTFRIQYLVHDGPGGLGGCVMDGESRLRVLRRAAGRAAAHRVTMHVICDRDHILRLFNLTGLDRRITVARTLTEALQSFPPAEATAKTGKQDP